MSRTQVLGLESVGKTVSITTIQSWRGKEVRKEASMLNTGCVARIRPHAGNVNATPVHATYGT
jgi:hypothetical protein